jgi:hypothetical protein
MSHKQFESFSVDFASAIRFFSFSLGCALCASLASATTISFSGTGPSGDAVSATADFTLGAGTATIKLTNTTATTHDAGDLLTGIDFSLGGLTPTLTSNKTGIELTVTGSGSFSDTGSAQTISSWSLASNGGGSFQLNFSPGPDDAIIGPPSSGNYSGANASIKGNGPHNPFIAEMGTFVLTNPNFTANTTVAVTKFYYGTDITEATGKITVGTPPSPEPSTLVLTLLAGLSLVVVRRLRSR